MTPNEGTRYLGLYLTTNRNTKPMESHLWDKAVVYTKAFQQTPMNHREAIVLYKLCFILALTYPLPAMWLPDSFLEKNTSTINVDNTQQDGISPHPTTNVSFRTPLDWRGRPKQPTIRDGSPTSNYSIAASTCTHKTRSFDGNTNLTVPTLGRNSMTYPYQHPTMPMDTRLMDVQNTMHTQCLQYQDCIQILDNPSGTNTRRFYNGSR